MMDQLPQRIVAVMIGTILVLVLTVGVSTMWLTGALDAQARENTGRQTQRAVDALLEGTELVTLDYAKWIDATDRAAAVDVAWFDVNMGIATVLGESCQLAALWGGGFAQDRGWTQGGTDEGRSGLVNPAILSLAEARLAQVPLAAFDGTSFFAWHGRALYAVAAARIEPPSDYLQGPSPSDSEIARMLMARRLDGDVLEDMAEDYQLVNLRIEPKVVAGRPAVPLLGGDDRALAFLVWDPPQPGSAMLRQMTPPLLGVVFLTMGLAGFGIALVRRNAQTLVLAERQASAAARTDAMTGLPNRLAFNEVLAAFARGGERAVLFLDVNDFKRINDSIGHEAGDQAIIDVAQRLGRLTGPGCFLARIAGDEFVFVVTGSDAEGRTKRLAGLVVEALAAPLSVLGHELQVGMAMGYAVQVVDDMTGLALVRQADLAMYEAKRSKEPGRLVAFSTVVELASLRPRQADRQTDVA